MKLNIHNAVLNVISALENKGYKAFCVGGAVRDLLMGRTPSDYDITTDALPNTVLEIFPKCVPTGIKHGTVTVIQDGISVEVTTFRSESIYTDSRHPDKVEFGQDIETDLARRDFTMNSIAYSPATGIIDSWNGYDDIKKKIIRTVGEPRRRFSEDLLRIMRCYRFAATLGFNIESETESAALSLVPSLYKVSRERLFCELINMLNGQYLDSTLHFFGIENIGLISLLPQNIYARFAAFCLLGGRDAETTAKQLKSSNHFIQKVKSISAVATTDNEDLLTARRLIVKFGKDNALLGLGIRKLILKKESAELEQNLISASKENLPSDITQLAVTGKDILEMGIAGKRIGEILAQLYENVLKDPACNNRESLLEQARKIL